MTLISLAVGALVALSYIPSGDAANVTGWLDALVIGVFSVGGNILLIYHYVRTRAGIKTALLHMAAHKQGIDLKDMVDLKV
jgi:hypothetical protein